MLAPIAEGSGYFGSRLHLHLHAHPYNRLFLNRSNGILFVEAISALYVMPVVVFLKRAPVLYYRL